jgi:hypothetical protein
MRLLSAAVCTSVAAALLASCSGGNMGSMTSSVPGTGSSASKFQALHKAGAVSIIPKSALPKGPVKLKGRQAPPQEMKGIYVAMFFESFLNGYTKNNSGNGAAICQVTGLSNVNNLATDTVGNLIVPNAFDGVYVYPGPTMCGSGGPSIITDSYGQASDAASVNAMTGPIVVGNILGPGYAVVCTVSSGSCSELTPPSAGIGEIAGVGMDKNGNCWADSYNAAFTAVQLTYWAGCSGTGTDATGFLNTGYGGVDVDNKGNIVTLNWHGSAGTDLWVYSGCNPACTSVSDNDLTENTAIFGHIGKQGQRLVVGAYLVGQADIYQYSPTTLTYYYSFNNGLIASGDVEGAAYSPSSKK